MGGKFRKRFEDLMSAASFAEAGEFETARDLFHGDKKVLLVHTGRESNDKPFRYALNAAKRIGAALRVLSVSRDGATAGMIESYSERARQEAVDFAVEQAKGCIKEAIIGHTKDRRDIQFVVVESNAVLEADCDQEDRKLRGTLSRLHCPLVMVSELNT
jgi:hypothetical protein